MRHLRPSRSATHPLRLSCLVLFALGTAIVVAISGAIMELESDTFKSLRVTKQRKISGKQDSQARGLNHAHIRCSSC